MGAPKKTLREFIGLLYFQNLLFENRKQLMLMSTPTPDHSVKKNNIFKLSIYITCLKYIQPSKTRVHSTIFYTFCIVHACRYNTESFDIQQYSTKLKQAIAMRRLNSIDLGIPYCCLDVDMAFILLIIWAFESKNDVHLELQV